MKKKRKNFWDKKIFSIPVDVYSVDVLVIVNMTGGEAYKAFSKKLLDSAKEVFRSHCDEWDADLKIGTIQGKECPLAGGFVVFLRMDKNYFRRGVGVLVHEMTHVTHYLLRNRRIPLTEDTEEAHTYLVQYLTTEALRHLY